MKGRCILAASVLLALPLLGQAYEAYTVDNVRLQSGPDEEYPTITELPAGAEVALQGCIDGWSWCDVIAGDDRGWVPASYLEEEFDNRRVLVVDYGPRIGIPVVGFSLGVYWDQHYHNRPWYHERASWEQRHITPRALPRPTTAERGGEVRGGAALSVREQREHDARNTTDAQRGGATSSTSVQGSVGASAEVTRRNNERSGERVHDANRATSSTSGSVSASAGSSSSTRSDSERSHRSSDRDTSSSTAQTSATRPATQTSQGSAGHDTQNTQQGEHADVNIAQGREHYATGVRQDQHEGSRDHRMPPQVQTARNSPSQQPPQSGASERHDQGRHEGERKGESKNDKGDNKDRDRDNDH